MHNSFLWWICSISYKPLALGVKELNLHLFQKIQMPLWRNRLARSANRKVAHLGAKNLNNGGNLCLIFECVLRLFSSFWECLKIINKITALNWRWKLIALINKDLIYITMYEFRFIYKEKKLA